jgi:hypothetical protein
MVFLADMKPFSDSLADPLSWHLIDYVIDASGKKKVRFQSFRPAAASYLLDQTEPAALRLEQDTIRIILEYPAASGRRHDGIRQDRLSLYLNNYHEMSNYITGGLNEKIRWLQKYNGNYWVRDKDKMTWRPEKDPTISAAMPAGQTGLAGDYIGSVVQLDLGNYKNYFAPAFGLGIRVGFNREQYTWSSSVVWEPLFLFATNAQGHAQTYRNEFLVLSFVRDWKGPISRPPMAFNLNPGFSFGWLVRRDGEFFEKNSFRFFLGRAKLFKNRVVLQPGMYFHDLFKEVTPAFNLQIGF